MGNQIDNEDDDKGPNNTLDGLLRKLEDGNAINEFGHEVQAYLVALRRAAKRGGKRVVGEVTIKLRIPVGQDGYGMPAAELKTKPIPKPARPESIVYIDEDGDINGLPVAKQTTIFEIKKNTNKDVAAPAAKGM